MREYSIEKRWDIFFSNHLPIPFFQPSRQIKNLLRPWWTSFFSSSRLSSSHFLLPSSSIKLPLPAIDKVLRLYIYIYIYMCVYLSSVSRTLRWYQYNWRHLLLLIFSFRSFSYFSHSMCPTFQYWPPITVCFHSHLCVPCLLCWSEVSMSLHWWKREAKQTLLYNSISSFFLSRAFTSTLKLPHSIANIMEA